MNFTLLPATPEDASFLAELFYEVHSPEFAVLGLPQAALAQLMDMQFRAQTTGYAAQFPAAVDQIVWVEQEKAGRLLVDSSRDSMQLVDVALLPRFRGQGIGTELVRRLVEEARAAGKSLGLSVRFDNPAERLYSRAGFVRSGGDGLNNTMELRPMELRPTDGAGTVQAPQPVEEQDETPVEQDFTSRYFRTLLGKQLSARGYDGSAASLLLESVTALVTHGASQDDAENNFVLNFTGPMTPILPSATAELTPPDAAPMTVFLVPLGPRDGAMQYEAVFNRWVPEPETV